MSEHIREAGPAAGVVVKGLAKGLAKQAAVSAAKKGAKSGARSLTGGSDAEIASTPARVVIKPRQTEEELELVCDYLLNEGFASTGVEAENIYTHMSEEWKEYILKGE